MQNVQSFRITDALRCTLLNAPRGPNLACPRPTVAGSDRPYMQSARLWRNAVMQPRNRLAVAHWQGARLTGLVSARTRAGHRAWDIDGLYLPAENLTERPCSYNDNGFPASDATGHHGLDEAATDSLSLLEELFQSAGERSAERIFVRLASNCPAISLARRSGFVACFSESLLEGAGPGIGNGSASPPKRSNSDDLMRLRLPADNYGLFQLYCASTPVRVRQMLWLTFDQWLDARDADCSRLAAGRHQEWVAEHKDRIIGWVKVTGRGGTSEAEVMAHPDRPDLLFELIDFALARAPRLRWLVPDYQGPVSDRLAARGFRQVADFTMLVKMVAVPAVRYGMATVEA
ncbi:hypothetical protein GBAR_LOCUS18784 [Geodia barretti]|uniref:Uncharacterized protein n=1 Tax=Geodia barretti TaxID=519541 RepID=A0AA35SNE3_GEOBA|nr:hypothetical protein GBAR_LOCUS18784 [Geodia barretti]